jgi:hypothetical protein
MALKYGESPIHDPNGFTLEIRLCASRHSVTRALKLGVNYRSEFLGAVLGVGDLLR